MVTWDPASGSRSHLPDTFMEVGGLTLKPVAGGTPGQDMGYTLAFRLQYKWYASLAVMQEDFHIPLRYLRSPWKCSRNSKKIATIHL